MKLYRNHDRFFAALFFLTVLLSPFSPGIKGQDWMRAYVLYAQLFAAFSYIACGPWFMSLALRARSSEQALTVWRKAWPFTFAFGILCPIAGIAALWAIFFMK